MPVGAPTGTGPTQNSATSGRGPFASALRNLAKQADIKEEECVDNSRSNSVGAGQGGSNNSAVAMVGTQQSQRTTNIDSRSVGDSRPNDNRAAADDRNSKKRPLSPQPPEKV